MSEAEWLKIRQAEKTGNLESLNVTPDPVAWGKGGPKLVTPATADEYEQVHFWYDLHVPVTETLLLNAAFTALENLKPHRLVIGGDIGDFAIISRFNLTERKSMTEWQVHDAVKSEADAAKQLLSRIRSVFTGPIEFVEGNHCQRLREWLGSEEHAAKWMGFDEHNVTYHNRSGFLLREDYLVKHGDYTTKNTAEKEYLENHCGGCSGHKHTDQVHIEVFPQTRKKFQWNSLPCMCRLDYDYGPGSAGLARWKQGIGVGSFSTIDPYDYQMDVGRWWNNKLHLHGQRYT